MLDENQKIEKRLAHMKNFYLKIEDILDSLPDVIPENTKDLLKNALFKKIVALGYLIQQKSHNDIHNTLP